MITNKNIDNGKAFDWGRTSEDYAKYRDIYPKEFYEKLYKFGIGKKGQKILDLGTGTGVLPRNMYKYGADFIGCDIAENQIKHAKILAQKSNMNIEFRVCPTEEIKFKQDTFDAICACQCFFYFNHGILSERAKDILKPGGKIAILYMAWLPYEDKIARESEKLILKYNPKWSGCNETRHKIIAPDEYNKYFKVEDSIIFDLDVPFTRESWNGRIKACRGIEASLSKEEVEKFDKEHMEMLQKIANDKFTVLHYAAMTILKLKDRA